MLFFLELIVFSIHRCKTKGAFGMWYSGKDKRINAAVCCCL